MLLALGVVSSAALIVSLLLDGPVWLDTVCFVLLLGWLVGYRLVTPTDQYHERVYDFADFIKSGGFPHAAVSGRDAVARRRGRGGFTGIEPLLKVLAEVVAAGGFVELQAVGAEGGEPAAPVAAELGVGLGSSARSGATGVGLGLVARQGRPPAAERPDDAVVGHAPPGILPQRRVPVGAGRQQIADLPRVAKAEREPMPEARIAGSGGIADQHHAVVVEPIRPDIGIGIEGQRPGRRRVGE